MICENGERQLRRSAPALSPFETGRAVVAELLAGVERFGLAASVDNPNDTSLRTTAAGVNLSIARPVFSMVGQCVHGAPLHGSKSPARRPLRDGGAKGAAPPGYARDGSLPLSPGGAAGATDPCGGSASGSTSAGFPGPGSFFGFAFIG